MVHTGELDIAQNWGGGGGGGGIVQNEWTPFSVQCLSEY